MAKKDTESTRSTATRIVIERRTGTKKKESGHDLEKGVVALKAKEVPENHALKRKNPMRKHLKLLHIQLVEMPVSASRRPTS